MSHASSKISVTHELSGQLLWIVLDDAPGNILDLQMVTAIHNAVRSATASSETSAALKAIVFEGRGAHFSFGASIPEHQPGKVEELVPAFHALVRELLDAARPTCAVVRGRCLGGGLELAAFCNRVFAAPDATFGLPEIKLGVFAPLGSLMLPERVGRACAEELCLSGRVMDATEANATGLIDVLHAQPAEAARTWLEGSVLPKSAVALRHATRALRHTLQSWLVPALTELEQLYLRELMLHEDPREGVTAFMEKREPVWKNR